MDVNQLNQQMQLGQLLMAPPAGVPMEETPEQFLARLQAFQRPRMMTPVNEALLQVGTQLMQPTMPGQALGNAANAVQAGVKTYNAADQRNVGEALALEQASGQRTARQDQRRSTAELIATSQQARGVAGAKAPIDLATAQKAYDLILAEEKAGNRGYEFLRRKALAEVALKEAQAADHAARAKYIGVQATANPRQIVNAQKMDDGTLVTHIIIGGKPYQEILTLARFNDPKLAREQAIKDTDEVTPGAIRSAFGAQAPYQGTREQEIERRMQELLTPKRTYRGPQGPLTEQQYQQIGAAADAAGTTPVPSPAPGSTLPMPPAFPQQSKEEAATETATQLRVLNKELSEETDPAQRAVLMKEIDTLRKNAAKASTQRPDRVNPPSSAATPTPPAATQATEFVKGADGTYVPRAGPQGSPSATAQQNQQAASAQRLTTTENMFRQANRELVIQWPPDKQKSDPRGYYYALTLVNQRKQELEQARMDAAAETKKAAFNIASEDEVAQAAEARRAATATRAIPPRQVIRQ